jgi:hypothetical protein
MFRHVSDRLKRGGFVLPRVLLAVTEVAESWLARSAAALDGLAAALSSPAVAVSSGLLVPGDSVIVRADGKMQEMGRCRRWEDAGEGRMQEMGGCRR